MKKKMTDAQFMAALNRQFNHALATVRLEKPKERRRAAMGESMAAGFTLSTRLRSVRQHKPLSSQRELF